ncbi:MULTISPECIES: hypothetical protein [Corynebacterium]|uniref:hypothetical protein n=1 Tax=Corynebacterium TaxID=1716 RepID=UPI0011CB4792|nr:MULTISPECIES: hypothetical protein [Corynebacterium]KAA9221534.1 hypothetical protein F6I44_08725 [Corynebacterium amycolatum]MBC6747909.1 hypothetical protein [Corynebacterium sp. LK25]MDK6443738.1 hypothetical protein [Corynebacterium amycolatum]TXS59931.1 hypothetical protein CHU67_05980 [Corynebacterium sp. LK19]TXS83762.1 hypothetical protein CHU70_05500 [Corynebacterium sp. LK10]
MTSPQAKKPNDPYVNQTKERRDVIAGLFVGVLALAYILLQLRRPVLHQQFPSDLTLLLPEVLGSDKGVPIEVMSGGALFLFIAATVVRCAIVAAIAVLCVLFSLSYLKGEFFTVKTARRVMAISWLAVIYPASGFLQLMGENWVAGDLNLSTWFQRDHADFYQHLGIWFVLMMVISTLGVMLFRAARMQEDQEGLI